MEETIYGTDNSGILCINRTMQMAQITFPIFRFVNSNS